MRTKYLCLKCWEKSPDLKLYYSCPECARQGNDHPFAHASGLRPVKDLVPRLKRLSPMRLDELHCPRHPDANLAFFCPTPKCKQPIRDDAAVDTSMLGLGVAGAPGAGKTMMMLSALKDLGTSNGSGNPVHLLGIGDTEIRFGILHDSLFEQRSKPKRTEASAGFGWRTRSPIDPEEPGQLLVMNDLDGDFWSGKDAAAEAAVSRYVRLLDKMVLVLDGARIAANLGLDPTDAWSPDPPSGPSDGAVLSYLLNRFGARAGQIDLALAISKGDLLWRHSTWTHLHDAARNGRSPRVNEEVRMLFKESKREKFLTFAHAFRRHQLFIFSSLGVHPTPEDVDAGEENRLKQPPEPVGASEPIRWLLNSEDAE